MVSAKLYVEGGGDSQSLRTQCREGFRGFLEKAGFAGCMPRIVACGGRQQAFDKFKTACKANEETAILLVDSEDLVPVNTSPWTFLENRPGDNMTKPDNTTDDHCHLMVVCMETWFLADPEALSRFFGQGFNSNALPKNKDVEAIPKSDVFTGLKNATRRCDKKGTYGKGDHSFKILLKIDPNKVFAVSTWAKRFKDKLDAIL